MKITKRINSGINKSASVDNSFDHNLFMICLITGRKSDFFKNEQILGV